MMQRSGRAQQYSLMHEPCVKWRLPSSAFCSQGVELGVFYLGKRQHIAFSELTALQRISSTEMQNHSFYQGPHQRLTQCDVTYNLEKPTKTHREGSFKMSCHPVVLSELSRTSRAKD